MLRRPLALDLLKPETWPRPPQTPKTETLEVLHLRYSKRNFYYVEILLTRKNSKSLVYKAFVFKKIERS